MSQEKLIDGPPKGWHFRVGLAFFVLGWVLPLMIPFVTASGLSTEWKTSISGLLLFGGPEVCSLVAIAFLGKTGFEYIKSRLFALLRRAAPSAEVSRTRYRFGLGLWGLLALYGVFSYYAPGWIPGYEEHRIAMNLVVDLIFVASFFVLGGDFWDKFHALFVYDARAVLPEAKSGG